MDRRQEKRNIGMTEEFRTKNVSQKAIRWRVHPLSWTGPSCQQRREAHDATIDCILISRISVQLGLVPRFRRIDSRNGFHVGYRLQTISSGRNTIALEIIREVGKSGGW